MSSTDKPTRGGKKPRTASDGALRTHTHMVRLSAAEEVRVVRAAGDRPVATWMREVVLAAAPSVTDDPGALRAAVEQDAPADHVHTLTYRPRP